MLLVLKNKVVLDFTYSAGNFDTPITLMHTVLSHLSYNKDKLNNFVIMMVSNWFSKSLNIILLIALLEVHVIFAQEGKQENFFSMHGMNTKNFLLK